MSGNLGEPEIISSEATELQTTVHVQSDTAARTVEMDQWAERINSLKQNENYEDKVRSKDSLCLFFVFLTNYTSKSNAHIEKEDKKHAE